ncbi:MAG: type II 3-dehydroquinate dehydratase [Bacteroidaceae bacterium]|nr:type II 3-dehydroquinate dehydratase [Bacteroidaceae bacterium]MBQ3623322.1 type II 3-dehydroquinate dehydratase [Bacteroidaceae bacterium]
MKKILVINGPNINMLGLREPALYGAKNFQALQQYILDSATRLGVTVELFQSNHEGDIVEKIQAAYEQFHGILINPAAYTHTSVAILDALKAVGLPTVEVHLTDISQREEFRRFSFVSLYAQKTICGKGFEGYAEGLEYLSQMI